eukprot:TRINITY_DN62383_c0_g1_i1.p1 TRINITY_DN62383_c0_g1~~TRINITY_DN62383_c0_g1_i1.p1  ORF type:complete len:318 (-),score=50.15 TRINITY_DN62383_c0_g1_i1:10-963(-)
MGDAAVPQLLGMVIVSLLSVGGRYWYQQSEQDQSSIQKQRDFSAANFAFIMFPYMLLRLVLAWRKRPKEATLHMRGLNQVHSFKDLFANYLQAALMEPMLAIAMQPSKAKIFTHLLMLASIAWWTWVISDAFDWGDTEQEFKYRQMVKLKREQHVNGQVADACDWLQSEEIIEDTHTGSMVQDLCLWFMILCICGQCCGLAALSDIYHAYFCLVLWVCLHHLCWTATTWGQSYLVSLFLPSAALMPLQFCFLLRAADSFEDLKERRRFVRERCGVNLTIVTDMVWSSNADSRRMRSLKSPRSPRELTPPTLRPATVR